MDQRKRQHDIAINDSEDGQTKKLQRTVTCLLTANNTDRPILILMLLNNLTQVSFTLDTLQSNDIEQFLKNHSHQIKLLHFVTDSHPNLDIEASKKSILSHLPHLKMFQFQFMNRDMLCDYTLQLYQSLFSRSTLPIRYMQQWLFTQEPMSEEQLHTIFCSFKLHRRKYYVWYGALRDKSICHVESVLHSVHHVIILDNARFSGRSFSNVTQLTLSKSCNSNCFASDEFHRVIPVSQITKLTIDNEYINFHEVLNVLSHTPNIHTLTLTSVKVTARKISSLQEYETFRMISHRNKIKHITITDKCTLKTIQMLINLCPELQHLTLGISRQSIEATVRYLLSENNEGPCHISSLCILVVDTMWIDKLKIIVESKKTSC